MGLLGAIGTGVGAYFGGTSGAGIGGAIGGGLDSMIGGNASNAMAADEAQRNREFQADMSSTAYQRAVADMKAAGLNPMLAYQQGGASSPGGSMASFSNPESATGSTMSGYTAAMASSAQIANVQADTENKKAQADLIAAQAAHAWSSAGQADANINLINSQADKVKAEIKNVPLEGNRLVRAAEALYQSANLDFQRQLNEASQRDVIMATARKLVADGTLSELDVKAAHDMGNAGRELGQLKPFFDLLINAIKLGSRR